MIPPRAPHQFRPTTPLFIPRKAFWLTRSALFPSSPASELRYVFGMLSEKPWRPEAAIRLLFWIVAAVCGVMFGLALGLHAAGIHVNPSKPTPLLLVLNTLGLHGTVLAAVALYLRTFHLGWRESFGIRPQGLLRITGLAALGLAIFLPVSAILQGLSIVLLNLFHLPIPEEQAVSIMQQVPPGWSQVYFFVFSVAIAPPAEEIIFRGVLYPMLKQSGFPRAAWIVAAGGFALIHMNAPVFLPLTALAVMLIWLYERTDNLLAPILAHGGFNALNIAIFYFGDHHLQSAAR